MVRTAERIFFARSQFSFRYQQTKLPPSIRLEIRGTTNQPDLIAQFDVGDIPGCNSLTWNRCAISCVTSSNL